MHEYHFPLQRLARRVEDAAERLPFAQPVGEVAAVNSSVVAVTGLSRWLCLGSFVDIETRTGVQRAEVVRLGSQSADCKPFIEGQAIALADRVYCCGNPLIRPHDSWKGRILDGLARPIDGQGLLRKGPRKKVLQSNPPNAMNRQLVSRKVRTGVRVIDIFTPLCFGQRLGIFAGSGVGKSSLLAMLCAARAFDTVVVSLVGERGREVREFVTRTLGPALTNSIAVVSTGDESALMRRQASLLATSLAEYFRDEGHQVLLVMDSLTRFAHACREIALASGEPPVARGYPPSVFRQLPQLLERAGPGAEGSGSITAIYAVLVDGDDRNDPVADAARGMLDGHVVLSRAIAEMGRFPAVDIPASLSRLADRARTGEEARQAAEWLKLIARFEDSRDLRMMGALASGVDTELDRAVAVVPSLYAALSQRVDDPLTDDAFAAVAESLSR